jgi:hypothetical protein
VVDQHLTRPEEKDIAEHIAAFLDALKGLETARKYTCQLDTKNIIIVMCNKVDRVFKERGLTG